ncbi:hypothetical protein [Nostoc sp.]
MEPEGLNFQLPEVKTNINSLKQQGCTILLVTHNNRILDIADRIV